MGIRPAGVLLSLFISFSISANAKSESQLKCKIGTGYLQGGSLIVSYDLKTPSKVRVVRDDRGTTVDEQECDLVQEDSAAMAFLCKFIDNGRAMVSRYLIRKGLDSSACETSFETVAGKFNLPETRLSCI